MITIQTSTIQIKIALSFLYENHTQFNEFLHMYGFGTDNATLLTLQHFSIRTWTIGFKDKFTVFADEKRRERAGLAQGSSEKPSGPITLSCST